MVADADSARAVRGSFLSERRFCRSLADASLEDESEAGCSCRVSGPVYFPHYVSTTYTVSSFLFQRLVLYPQLLQLGLKGVILAPELLDDIEKRFNTTFQTLIFFFVGVYAVLNIGS